MLPEGWHRSTLGEIGVIKSGSTPERAKHERYFADGKWPWVKTMDLTNNKVEITDERITDAALSETSCKLFPKGTVLVAMYGGFKQIGRTGVLDEPSAVNQAISAIEINPTLADSMYTLHWLNGNRECWRDFAASSRKDPNITREDVCRFPIVLPRLIEQRRIASVLSTWDEAISATESLLANSRSQKQALMQSLLSNAYRERRGLPPLPTKHASEIFSAYSVRRNEGFDLLSVLQEGGIVPRSSLTRKVVMPEGSTDGYKLVEPGNFVISLRSFEGGLEYSRYTGLVSPAYTVLKANGKIDPDFYRHYFKSKEFIGRLSVAVIGIRDGKQVSYDDFSFLRIPAPSLEEQKRISETLNLAEADISKRTSELAKLRDEKAALMQQLLTGKRRVRLPAPTETEPA